MQAAVERDRGTALHGFDTCELPQTSTAGHKCRIALNKCRIALNKCRIGGNKCRIEEGSRAAPV
jgi:hypothetical protein